VNLKKCKTLVNKIRALFGIIISVHRLNTVSVVKLNNTGGIRMNKERFRFFLGPTLLVLLIGVVLFVLYDIGKIFYAKGEKEIVSPKDVPAQSEAKTPPPSYSPEEGRERRGNTDTGETMGEM